jgi:putative addiction module component (TIGR02574 family)
MANASEILHAARTLSHEERAALAHELLITLEPESDVDVEQAWADEIRRRLRAIREGRVVPRDWDEALTDIRKSLDVERPA